MTCTSTPTCIRRPNTLCLLCISALSHLNHNCKHVQSLFCRSHSRRRRGDAFSTMNALTPLVFALSMVCSLAPTSATVVQDFNHVERCKDSLYMGTPPRGIIDSKLKKICQRYADKPRYVTLYDPQKRIPVYSAYTFKKTEGDRRVDYPWMYEPQVRGLSLSHK